MRADLARAIRDLPWDLSDHSNDTTKALFAKLHAGPPYPGIDIARDQPYGPHRRHRLDVFTDGPGTGKPVFVYVHGGGFVAGDKVETGYGFPFYENIGVWAARQGFVGVNITYRLAPEHLWPAGPEDLGAAVGWLHANISRWGGDPERIVLMGQSAGATHVGAYAAMPEVHPVAGGGVRSFIAFSSAYDFTQFEPPSNVSNDRVGTYFGDNLRNPAASPLARMATLPQPLLIAHAEYDPVAIHIATRLLFDARFSHLGRCPDFSTSRNTTTCRPSSTSARQMSASRSSASVSRRSFTALASAASGVRRSRDKFESTFLFDRS